MEKEVFLKKIKDEINKQEKIWNELRNNGFKIPKYRFYNPLDIEDFLNDMKTFKLPIVMKAFALGISHKGKLGMVEKNIFDEDSFYNALNKIEDIATKLKYKYYFMIQEQKEGIELFLSYKKHELGEFISFGIGGILVEFINKNFTALFNLKRIEKKFYENGFDKIYKIEELNQLLIKLRSFLRKNNQIKTIEFNPIIFDKKKSWIIDVKLEK